MLATLTDKPFDDKKWVFETKWDGFRLVTEKRGNTVRLWSRNGIDVTSRYTVLLPTLQKVEGSCVMDGEICALDAQGRSRFQLLQNALNKKAKLLYVVFDALFVGDNDIRQNPLLERKQILKALLPRDPLLRYSEHVAEFGKREFAKAQRAHEEGVIAKRAAGLYYSGKRTREWLKFKAVHEQEVVIVGYTEPRRSRKYFGSLVLAVRDKAKKSWTYAGHVGTGFDQAALKSIYETMQPLRTDKKSFDQKVKNENETAWLIPKLVGEVKFTEWTSESEMRHPAFLGLRTDKKALDVIREQA
jgi:bifunctional non-homologous end joining protein LigD